MVVISEHFDARVVATVRVIVTTTRTAGKACSRKHTRTHGVWCISQRYTIMNVGFVGIVFLSPHWR